MKKVKMLNMMDPCSGEYYKNSNGLDDEIVSKCLTKAAQARKLKIPITTFMARIGAQTVHKIDKNKISSILEKLAL